MRRVSVPLSRLWSPVKKNTHKRNKTSRKLNDMNYNIIANANRDDVWRKRCTIPMIESSKFVDNFA